MWNINPFSFLYPALKKLSPDDYQFMHVHSSIYFTSWQAVFARKWNKIPLLLQFHGGVGLPEVGTSIIQSIVKKAFDQLVMNRLLKGSDWIGSVSRPDLKLLEKQFGCSGVYIPNAIDWQSFSREEKQSKEGPIKIGYIGDLEPWKGVNDLVEAFCQLKLKGVELHIVGSGSLATKLRQKAKKSDLIYFHNTIPHSRIKGFYQHLDLVCLPSYWEGAPTIILEAISMGIPVCASSVGEIPAMLPKKWLFRPKKVNELAEKLSYMLDNLDNFKEEVKSWQKVLKSEFSWENVINILEKTVKSQF
jgi:teichuronic acid biosynthesis glycosyltransferase TuaC